MEKNDLMKEYEIKIDSIVNWEANPIGYTKYLESELVKERSKPTITYQAVETFQEIIRNQCDEITALKEKAEAYDSLMSGEPTAKEKIVDAIKAYRELCVCYRVGRQPSEKLFTRLKKADELLKTLEES